VGLAILRSTREIVGVVLGDRSRQTANQLWDSLPAVYRQCAGSLTDFWIAINNIFPSTRHRTKGSIRAKLIILKDLIVH